MKALIRPVVAAILTLLIALAASACGDDASAGRSVTLTAEDSGRAVEVKVSDEIVITLGSNITTGFAWALTTEPDADVLELVDSQYRSPETDLLGAGGNEVWTFAATGEGTTSFTLTYQRASGETTGEPFALTVDVAPAG